MKFLSLQEKRRFDGTCPFSEKAVECSFMNLEECNICSRSYEFRERLMEKRVPIK